MGEKVARICLDGGRVGSSGTKWVKDASASLFWAKIPIQICSNFQVHCQETQKLEGLFGRSKVPSGSPWAWLRSLDQAALSMVDLLPTRGHPPHPHTHQNSSLLTSYFASQVAQNFYRLSLFFVSSDFVGKKRLCSCS